MSLDGPRIVRWLYAITFGLVLAHIAAYTIKATTGHDNLFGLFHLVDLNDEANLPTWFSTMLLAASALLLAIIARKSTVRRDRVYWNALSALFVFLSLDEFAQLHELIGSWLSRTPIQNLLPDERSSAWIFWGAALCLCVAIGFFRFWLRLQPRIRTALMTAAVVYTAGALGLEIVEVYYLAHFGNNLGFVGLFTLEELMEMVGIILLLDALLAQLALSAPSLEVRLK